MDGRRGGQTYADIQVHMDIYDIYDPLDGSGRTDKVVGQNVPS